MTIIRGTIITITTIIALFVFQFLIGLVVTSNILNNYIPINQNLIGISLVLPYIIIYFIVILFFKISKFNFSLLNNTIQPKKNVIIYLFILFLVGNKLIDLPFFDWKILFNKYLGKSIILPKYSNQEYSISLVYIFINAVILSPFFEEYIFRYFIFGGFLKKYNFLTSLFTSSLLFSMLHVLSPQNLVPTFILGLTSGMIYYYTKKIRFSIVLHGLYNILWFFTFIFSEKYENLKSHIGYHGIYWLLFFIGGLFLNLGFNKIVNGKFSLAFFWLKEEFKNLKK